MLINVITVSMPTGFLKSTVVANIPRIIVSTYKITADKKKAS